MEDLLPLRFHLPLQKSRQVESKHGEKLWVIQGVGATDQEDLQKERLILKGMDFSPFLERGIINWNHESDPGSILGEPMEAKIIEGRGKDPSKFFVKGWLYKHQKKSQDLWNHLETLEKGEQPFKRGIGWSVQGGVIERQGNDLIKSVIRMMALTHEPVNESTWARTVKDLVKSLQGVGLGTAGYPEIGAQVSNLGPFIPQNLDGTITKLIYDPCPNNCIDPQTKSFANGYHGLLDHLALCKSVPVPEAQRLVSLIIGGRYLK